MFLQLDISSDQILSLTPYSPMIWGFVIFLLMSAIVYFYKQNEKKQEYIDKLIDKTHSISDIVSEKLSDIKNHNESKDAAIITALEDIKRRLETFVK
jgi:hypothetical protein